MRYFLVMPLAMLFLTVNAATKNYDFYVDGFYYKLNADKQSVTVTYGGDNAPTATSYHYYSGNVVVPETVDYSGNTYAVTAIGRYSFSYCANINSIKIGNSVNTIEAGAFSYSGVIKLEFGDNVEVVGSGICRDCNRLSSVSLGKSLISLESDAFYNCMSLSSIILPSKLEIIGSSAFTNCRALNNIVIPASVKKIGGLSFMNCTALNEIVIPDNVEMVGNSAYEGCVGAEKIIIGSGVTSIEQDAFKGCISVKSIIAKGNNPPKIIPHSYEGVSRIFDTSLYDTATLYVPSGRVFYYLAKDGWREFQIVEEGLPKIDPVYKPDVNNDGKIDVDDINIIIDAILGV